MSRRASATFLAAAEECDGRAGEPLFEKLRVALAAAALISKGDEYRADRAEQETMTAVPVAYSPLLDALRPVAEVLAPPEPVQPF